MRRSLIAEPGRPGIGEVGVLLLPALVEGEGTARSVVWNGFGHGGVEFGSWIEVVRGRPRGGGPWNVCRNRKDNWVASEYKVDRMRNQILVREYETRDRQSVEELLRIGIEDQQIHAAQAVPPEDEGFPQSEMEEHLAGLDLESASWWVAESSEGTVTGCMWLRAGNNALGPYRSVRQIIVSPSFRGRGIGAALLEVAEDISRGSDAVMLLISGYRTNPALRLYRRVGFTEFPPHHRRDTNPNNIVLWKPFKI